MSDPIEDIVAAGLTAAGIEFIRDGEGDTKGLDYLLKDSSVSIEAKQFPTSRTNMQMARVNDIIVIQGRRAAEEFARLITEGRR